ncbi:MAG: Uma2 family endonuclease [Verrucomicrobiota bacterium]
MNYPYTMSAAAEKLDFITPEEYYRMERIATEKHDYYEGEIFNMSGGTTNHSKIKTDLLITLGVQLKGKPCQPLDSDQRVKVMETGLRTYPDASVFCEEIEYDSEDDQKETAINPTVVFEVLSDSNEEYDRGLKATNYRMIESLKAHLLISQNQPHVEMYERMEDGDWRFREVSGLDAEMEIRSIDVSIRLSEIYGRIIFDA